MYRVDDVARDVKWAELSDVLVKQGTAALLDAPTAHPGTRTGLLSFSSDILRGWTDLERRTLRDAADFFANTLADAHRRQLLKDSESRFRMLLEQRLDGVSVLVNGRIVYANPATARILGHDAAELQGLDPSDIVTPRHKNVVAERIAEVATGEAKGLPNEYEAIRKDGTRFPIEVFSQRIVYEGHPALLATIRDLTDKRRIETKSSGSRPDFRRCSKTTMPALPAWPMVDFCM